MLQTCDGDAESEDQRPDHRTSNHRENELEMEHACIASSLSDSTSQCGSPAWTRIRTPSPDNSYAARLAARGRNVSQLACSAQLTQMIQSDVCAAARFGPIPRVCSQSESLAAMAVFPEGEVFISGSAAAGPSPQSRAQPWISCWPSTAPAPWQSLPPHRVVLRVGDTLTNSTCSTDVASSAGTSEGLTEAEVACPAGQLGLLGPQLGPTEQRSGGRGDSHGRSRGSAGHPQFCSKPCPFVASRRGCMEGAKCSRCHLCPQRKPRKKKEGLQSSGG